MDHPGMFMNKIASLEEHNMRYNMRVVKHLDINRFPVYRSVIMKYVE